MSAENFPPPSGIADQIAAKAIECLDRDIWHELTDNHITIRSVKFGLSDTRIILGGEVIILGHGAPSVAYQQAFQEAYLRAMSRKRDRLMEPKLKAISDERFDLWPKVWLTVRAVGGLVLAVAVVSWAVGGVTSCAVQENERIAKAAEGKQKARELVLEERLKVLDAVTDGTLAPDIPSVNKYGFKRANLPLRHIWPDDCDIGGEGVSVGGYRYEFASIYECKTQFERWESYGEIWVDWKAEP